MSLKSELNRLRKMLADVPADATDGRVTWAQLFFGPVDERVAHWRRHRERCRQIALATPAGRALVAEHQRLGLPPPDDCPADAVEQVIRLIGVPTPPRPASG